MKQEQASVVVNNEKKRVSMRDDRNRFVCKLTTHPCTTNSSSNQEEWAEETNQTCIISHNIIMLDKTTRWCASFILVLYEYHAGHDNAPTHPLPFRTRPSRPNPTIHIHHCMKSSAYTNSPMSVNREKTRFYYYYSKSSGE